MARLGPRSAARGRNHGCRWSHWRAGDSAVVVLENRQLRVSVLPEHGADIVEFRHKASDVDMLWRSPWPLPPPASAPAWSGPADTAFLDAYQGGWQVQLPICGTAADYHGLPIGTHGEAWSLPWRWWLEHDEDDEVAVAFEVDLVRSPFRILRVMRLRGDRATLVLDERVTNLSPLPLAFMWGHHPTFGAPFLKAGCRITSDARSLRTSSLHHDPHSRLGDDQCSDWPEAVSRDGARIDLSYVPGPEASIHDWAYLGDFAEGWVAIREPDAGLGFALRFQAELFPFVLYWQNFTGAKTAPWFGRCYVAGLEPQSSFPADFERGGPHLRLEPAASLEARFVASAFVTDGEVRHVADDGTVT